MKIALEYLEGDRQDKRPIPRCSQAFLKQYCLPCYHKIKTLLEGNLPLNVGDIDRHWLLPRKEVIPFIIHSVLPVRRKRRRIANGVAAIGPRDSGPEERTGPGKGSWSSLSERPSADALPSFFQEKEVGCKRSEGPFHDEALKARKRPKKLTTAEL